MVDRVLLSAGLQNIHECVQIAVQRGLGIEVIAFAGPDVMDGDWKALVDEYKPLLQPVRGMITMHGPFMDMAPGSPDKRINQVVIERYQHAIRIAQSLGVEILVLHANFIASIQTESYRQGWQKRNVAFWNLMADYARQHDVILAVENMWEFDPDIIGDVLKAVNHPNLRACLDVGHAHLFSAVPFEDWLATLEPFIVHTHMNNNDGVFDVHRALTDGVIDYPAVLRQIRGLPQPPTITLEMETVDDMVASFEYLELPQASAQWRTRVASE